MAELASGEEEALIKTSNLHVGWRAVVERRNLPEFAKLCGNLLNFHKVRKRNRRQQGAAPRNNFKTLHSANVRSF